LPPETGLGAGGNTLLADKEGGSINAGAAAEVAGDGCNSCTGVCACVEATPARLNTKANWGKQAKARMGEIETLNIEVFMAGLGLKGQR
jgi:hypothetical protein